MALSKAEQDQKLLMPYMDPICKWLHTADRTHKHVSGKNMLSGSDMDCAVY
jgi:hypothetical protein